MHRAGMQSEQRLARLLERRPGLRSVLVRLDRCIPLPVRWRENLHQWLLRAIHEEDFLIFDQLHDAAGLFLDIGANRGHAAITVLRRTRRFRVVSLEPNPQMRWSLLLLAALHPFRFRFRLLGAGENGGEAELRVPLAGLDLSTQASLDASEFDKADVDERLRALGHGGSSGEFKRIRVRMCRVDDLGLQPEVVKIDVEGWERQVLAGMPHLLSSFKPVLIIEINNSPLWGPMLAQLGYGFFSFENGRLKRHSGWLEVPGLNMWCLHPESPSKVSAVLLAGLPDEP